MRFINLSLVDARLLADHLSYDGLNGFAARVLDGKVFSEKEVYFIAGWVYAQWYDDAADGTLPPNKKRLFDYFTSGEFSTGKDFDPAG